MCFKGNSLTISLTAPSLFTGRNDENLFLIYLLCAIFDMVGAPLVFVLWFFWDWKFPPLAEKLLPTSNHHFTFSFPSLKNFTVSERDWPSTLYLCVICVYDCTLMFGFVGFFYLLSVIISLFLMTTEQQSSMASLPMSLCLRTFADSWGVSSSSVPTFPTYQSTPSSFFFCVCVWHLRMWYLGFRFTHDAKNSF